MTGAGVSIDCSVIIINYRTLELTKQALQSLFDTLPDEFSFEVLVVDNASGDGSAAAIRAAFPACTVIESQVNGGFAMGNNLAIRRARGRYLLLLNSDTIVLPGAIGTVIRYLDERPRVGIAGCRLYYPDMSHQHSLARLPTLRLLFDEYILKLPTAWYREEEYGQSMPVGSLIGAFMLVSAEAVRQVGLLDERYFMNSEDVDWCCRMWRHGFEVHYCADAAIIHIGSQSINQQRRKMNIELHKNRVKYFLFNRGVAAACIAAIIMLVARIIEPVRTLLRKTGIMSRLQHYLGRGTQV